MSQKTSTEQPEDSGDTAPSAGELARRAFLKKLSLTLGVAGGAAISIPGLGFVVAPLFRSSPREWRPVGKVASFEIGSTVSVKFLDASPLPWAGVSAKSAAWLRRTGPEAFIAFAVNCSHLGCPVRWMQSANLFLCPCHGGVYYANGEVAGGPPPHALTQYEVRVQEGEVQLLTAPVPIG